MNVNKDDDIRWYIECIKEYCSLYDIQDYYSLYTIQWIDSVFEKCPAD